MIFAACFPRRRATPASARHHGGLDRLPLHRDAVVRAVEERQPGDPVARRLRQLGFLPGERLALVARGPFGGDPVVVRIGASRFALRRAEAARVQVDESAA